MRAVTFSRLGGPEVLEVSELPEPTPGGGEVRIRVAAATVNPTDISFRSGRQFTVAQLAEMGVRPPFIPGMELAGVVDAVGEGATFRKGERVMAIVNPRRPGGVRRSRARRYEPGGRRHLADERAHGPPRARSARAQARSDPRCHRRRRRRRWLRGRARRRRWAARDRRGGVGRRGAGEEFWGADG